MCLNNYVLRVHACADYKIRSFFFFLAPTAPPADIRSYDVTPNTLSIRWEMVPCIHHNGDITGYSVQIQGNGTMETRTVTGANVLMTSFTGLLADTHYTVAVAGENSISVGEYGSLTVTTPQS